jgi:hypothetical protein
MAHLSNQTVNNLKKATDQLLKMTRIASDVFSEVNSDVIKSMNVEDAKKYSNFVERSAEVGVEQAAKEALKDL